MSVRRRAVAGAALALALVRCAPDFESLSSGRAGSSGSAGSAQGGSNDGGRASAGASAGEAEGGATAMASSGEGGMLFIAGGEGGGEPSAGAAGSSGAPGEAGAGGSPVDCAFAPQGTTTFNGFDGGLDGAGFSKATTQTSVVSTHGTETSSEWEPVIGNTCPGSLHLEAQFKDYASGTAADEFAYVDLRFTNADWSGAEALHAWVKVDPGMAPIAGLQFFVISGPSFSYSSVFEANAFRSGEWTEIVLPLTEGAKFDPTMVYRLGLELPLNREGAAGNPPVPPTVEVWMDDVWVER